MDTCPDCTERVQAIRKNGGRVVSLIKYYTPDKTHLVRVCINRWNPIKDRHCGYADKIPLEVKKADDKASKLSSEV